MIDYKLYTFKHKWSHKKDLLQWYDKCQSIEE